MVGWGRGRGGRTAVAREGRMVEVRREREREKKKRGKEGDKIMIKVVPEPSYREDNETNGCGRRSGM